MGVLTYVVLLIIAAALGCALYAVQRDAQNTPEQHSTDKGKVKDKDGRV